MSTMNILLVEDDNDNRECLRDLLSEEGYYVRTASDGREALDILLTETPPNLILADVHMPILDGIEMTRTIKAHERYKNIPVILLTGNAYEKVEDVPILFKPFSVEAVIDMIERFRVNQ